MSVHVDDVQTIRVRSSQGHSSYIDAATGKAPVDAPTPVVASRNATPLVPAFLLPNATIVMDGDREGALGQLAHYEILDVLGQGGFGVVVKAFDQTLHRRVAIKALLPQSAVAALPRASFLHEARAAAKIHHDNVVQIFSVEEYPVPYLVMEYIEGETLDARLARDGAIDSAEAARIGREIALGLAAAHAKGVVHRDIKPANILLEASHTPGGPSRVKIADFGVARAIDDAGMSQHGIIVGTPMYMAPEQANGQAVDHRSDLFSLGSVLYAMVTGHPPFQAATATAVLKRVAEDSPQPIRKVKPAANRGLCAVIERLLSKSPAKRYPSALAAAEALEACLDRPKVVSRSRQALVWGTTAALIAFAAYGGFVSGKFTSAKDIAAAPVPKVAEPAPKMPGDESPKAPTAKAPKAPAAPAADPLAAPPVAVFSKDQKTVAEWEAWVAQLPPQVQVSAVDARMRQLNPEAVLTGFNVEIRDGAVDVLAFSAVHLHDISPIRALKKLRTLGIFPITGLQGPGKLPLADLSPLAGTAIEDLSIHNSSVADLTPLKDLRLVKLSLWSSDITDLSPLRGHPIRILNCGGSSLRDLSPLKGMPLTFLCANWTQVDDVSPLADSPLVELLIETTKVRDISPVMKPSLKTLRTQGSPVENIEQLRQIPQLENLSLNYHTFRHLALVASMPDLQTVNTRPIGEFLATETSLYRAIAIGDPNPR